MNGRAIPKTRVFVEICLDDGTAFSANMFVQNQSRLSDVLNDDRKFLPMQTIDGKLLAIAKTAIKYVTLPVGCGSGGESARHCRAPTHAVLSQAGSVGLPDEKV
ncbi:MAG TPA: hypothetical protein VFW28_01650 [Micropepsaceae bacterium]|nr:hypothetical protein [Micropepsaceae bacterium]